MTNRKYHRCVRALARFTVNPNGDIPYFERKGEEKASLEAAITQYEMENM